MTDNLEAWHAAILAECQMTEACYVEADPAGTVRRLIDWHVDVTVRSMIDWRKEDAAAVPQHAADLHAAIMALPCVIPPADLWQPNEWKAGYAAGHRDALTAAAALVKGGRS